MGRRDLDYLKPERFRHYFTIIELSRRVEKDPSWIKRLERDGRIPVATRISKGELQIRLWSPEQVDEIELILAEMKPGRPPGT
jgi:hypothetical protein